MIVHGDSWKCKMQIKKSIYLWEERCDDGSGDLLLSLQLNLDQHWTATVKEHGHIYHN